MALLDPQERIERGTKAQAELTATALSTPATLFEASVRDYVYAEVWTRPGLDLRARFLISLAGAACEKDPAAALNYARGALANEELTVSELREAALHVAVYGGWTEGALFDKAVTDAVSELGLSDPGQPGIRTEAWDPTERHEKGSAEFIEAMKFGGPPPHTAYFEGGILNFVFGEMWHRSGLDQRSRRWLTLVGVGNSAARTPIRSHVWSAMASGNASKEEMFEFVLQYAIHAGWPKGSVMQSAVLEQAPRVEEGLPFEA